jgi:predicted ATPase
MTISLRSIHIRNPDALPDGFPFDVPVVRTLEEIEFTSPVTILVGENGSGKSTLLEAIGSSASLPTIGSISIDRDETLAAAHDLARHLVLTWNRRTHRGFYLRSEDFFGFALGTNRTINELAELAESFEPGTHARAAVEGQRFALVNQYGDLDARSHGESFFHVFARRINGDGLYLMDEPEVALSPQRQIALIALITDAVELGAQFIIATHAPMLMAIPGAQILVLSDEGITPTPWDEVEHVHLTRDFLTDPDLFLRHL